MIQAGSEKCAAGFPSNDRNRMDPDLSAAGLESRRASSFFGRIKSSPVLARVIPFAVFALLTIVQGQSGDSAQYWIYALKTIVAAWLLWLFRTQIPEIKWKFSWESVVVGIAVFAAWIGLDGYYPIFPREGGFNPARTYGQDSALSAIFIGVRMLGSTLIVPMLEEVFYRSFLYRYVIHSQFWKMPLGRFDLRAFLIVGFLFGISHFEWVPGILCAFAYQALVCRKNRLGDAMSAHALTNLLLGIWVVSRGAYNFW
jgi:uncharacterized protein